MTRTLLLSLLVALVVVVPRSALAHDELISSDPLDGATVAGAPAGVTLTFSGQVAQVGAAVVVTDADGASMVQGTPLVEGTEVVQPLGADLAPGEYAVTWRVTSQDGHPISGSFSFTVEGSGTDEDAAAAGDPAAAAPATQEPAEESADEPADEPAPAPAPDVTEDADGGLPVWVWLVLGVAVAGLLALLVREATKNRV